MINVLALNRTKEMLTKMTPRERGLFLLFGYVSNRFVVEAGDDCDERDPWTSRPAGLSDMPAALPSRISFTIKLHHSHILAARCLD